MITTTMQDVRYALRQLRKTPGFTFVAVLTLALGIGANAAIFTLVNAVLMRNLPVADPKTLVRIGDNNDCCVSTGFQESGNYALFPTETYLSLKKNVLEFEELAAMEAGFRFRPIIVRRNGNQQAPRSANGEFVSGNYFRTFGLQPQAGRLFFDSDDVKGAPVVAVMSYSAWQRDYLGSAAVVGSTVWVNTKPVSVVGIAPRGFYGDRLSSNPPDFYLPIETMPALAEAPYVHDPDAQWLYLVGRVKPDVSIPQLQQKISALVKQSFAEGKVFSAGAGRAQLAKVHVVLTPGGGGIQELQEQYASNLHLLMAISGLVLLIACANIANLLLARGMGRKAEISVRTALGAMRGRIVRQLLTESVVLAGMSGLVGLAVAYAGARMLLMLAFSQTQNVPIDASPSAPVLAFACGLSLLTGVLFGIAPAWIVSHSEPVEALRGARTTAKGASRMQRGLVVLQAALSLVLLAGAGLFWQSLNRLQHTDFKLQSKNRYIVHINPQTAGYSGSQLEALYRTIEQRFHTLPEILKVGICTYTAMEDNNWSTSVQVQGQPDLNVNASFVKANAEYFGSIGTRVVMGRGIGPQDTSTARAVSVVNQEFVKKLFQNRNPIGQHFGSSRPDSTGDFEIVGVVEDTTYTTPRWKDHAMYFVPMMQRPLSDKSPVENDQSLYAGAIVLETTRPINDLESKVRATLASINPNLTVMKFQTFDQQIANVFADDRMIAQLTMLFAVLALMLATVGLYGVTAYTVARRTTEIGIRMALGAERVAVVAMVMQGVALQAALGLAIGVPVALLCVRFVRAQLYHVTSMNISVLASAIVPLAIAACLAGLVPARRAASTDPAQSLRSE
ncbi:MAG TPA: ABC transporter permease [Terriglobales bacterium]|nr:ABC transporter permease [Terriglobales bacterium]